MWQRQPGFVEAVLNQAQAREPTFEAAQA